MSDAAETLFCTHCETRFRLSSLDDVVYRCICCLESVGPATEPDSPTRYLYSPELLQGTSRGLSSPIGGGTPDRNSPLGMTKIGRYTLRRELGRGGMGVVYLAHDAEMDREVALKVLLAGEFAHGLQSERFLREARAAAQLSHDAIVEVFELGQVGTRPFFVMAYIDGVTLRDVVDHVKRLPPDEACRIASQIARGLSAAHSGGFAHRDVKPSNILIEVDGRSYITDFGLVIGTDSSRLTQTGTVMGTPAYMAPELARAETHPDWPQSDVYALGAVLYEMVTGCRPYTGEAGTQVLLDILTEAPVPATTRVPSLDPALSIIIERAMARDSTYRYESAEALADDLDRFLRGEKITARALPRSYRALQFAKERQWPLIALLATVVLTLLGTGAMWIFQDLVKGRHDLARERLAEERMETMDATVNRLTESGDLPKAARVFSTFANADAHMGTRALSRAWLRQAKRAQNAGRLEDELTALGTAFTSTSDDALQDETLLQMAKTFRRQFWWNRMDAALDRIHTDDPERQIALLELRVESAVALRDLNRALDILTRAEQNGQSLNLAHFKPLLENLAQGTPLSKAVGRGTSVDVDQDGRKEIVFLPTPQNERLRALSPDTLKVIRDHPFPAQSDDALHALDAKASLFVGVAEGHARVYLWTSDGLVEVGHWKEEGALTSTATVDVEGDGLPNHFLGFGAYTRHLSEITIDPPSAVSPHPPTDAVQSDIAAMIGMDLTGDGIDELVVAAGPWNAWDLRVLTDDGSGLHLLGRTKIGFVGGLARLQRGGELHLVAAKSDLFSSNRDFPAATPFGAPAGVYLFSWAAPDLVERAFFPMSPPPGERIIRLSEPVITDLDADGLDDLVVNASTDTLSYMRVFRQRQDGSFAGLNIQGFRAITVSDTHLVVAESDASKDNGDAWYLGRGTQFPPPIPAYEHSTTPVPPMPPEESGTWHRAETLLQLGLIRQAAATLEDLGTLVSGTETAGRAWLRAGGIREEAGDPASALRDYEEAAGVAAVAASARLSAARLQYAEHRFEASHTMAETLSADADPTTRAAVEALWPSSEGFSPTSVVELHFDTPLAQAWQINPLAVRRDPLSKTLLVTAVTGQGDIARLPLRRVGPLAMTVDFTVDRLEWAAGVQILLQPRGEDASHAIGTGVAGWGGGGLLDREVGCTLPGKSSLIGARSQANGPGDRISLKAELRSAKGQDALYCRITDSENLTLHASRDPVALSETDAWDLVIATAGDEAAGAPMLSRITLSQITLEGVTLDPEAHGPEPLAGPLPVTTEGWIRALRTRHTSVVRPARATLRQNFFPAYATSWLTAAEMHPNDAEIQQALMSDLDGLASFTPRTPDEHTQYRNLLYLRGRAHWRAGHPKAALQDLEAVFERAPTARESTIFGVQFKAHRLAATIAMSTADTDTALAHVKAAIASSRSPELARDRLLLDAQLEAMREDPAWTVLFDTAGPESAAP